MRRGMYTSSRSAGDLNHGVETSHPASIHFVSNAFM